MFSPTLFKTHREPGWTLMEAYALDKSPRRDWVFVNERQRKRSPGFVAGMALFRGLRRISRRLVTS
jgi:hypothetical protein